MSGVPSLKVLTLNLNYIEAINPNSFDPVAHSLTFIDLTRNDIQFNSLSEMISSFAEIKKISTLKELNILGNPFTKTFEEYKVFVLLVHDMDCLTRYRESYAEIFRHLRKLTVLKLASSSKVISTTIANL